MYTYEYVLQKMKKTVSESTQVTTTITLARLSKTFTVFLFSSDEKKDKHRMRSWVQTIPPGPFLPIVQLWYCLEFNLDNCWVNIAAMIWINHIQKSLL
jgi:hypothetical protein